MGKRLIQQRRGRKNTKFNAPSHRYKGKIKYSQNLKSDEGIIVDLVHDSGRTAPLALVRAAVSVRFTGSSRRHTGAIGILAVDRAVAVVIFAVLAGIGLVGRRIAAVDGAVTSILSPTAGAVTAAEWVG